MFPEDLYKYLTGHLGMNKNEEEQEQDENKVST